MDATSFHIATPTTSLLCSKAGLGLLAAAADQAGVVGSADAQLDYPGFFTWLREVTGIRGARLQDQQDAQRVRVPGKPNFTIL